ncbi:MAG: immune inhibitor A [Chloroflexi bacterium]|nr:immune inhibitor A [Chloroflexota bacterium]
MNQAFPSISIGTMAIGVAVVLLGACTSGDTASPDLHRGPGATANQGNAPSIERRSASTPAPLSTSVQSAGVPTPVSATGAPQEEPLAPSPVPRLGSPQQRSPTYGSLAAIPNGPRSEFPDPPDADRYQLAAELVPGTPRDVPRVVDLASPDTIGVLGRKDTFWLVDLGALEMYQSEFELRLVTPHAYWYIEDGQSISQVDLERSASRFEEEIYPRVTGAFGKESSPGIDNDPHLNILNARLKSTGGYYSSGDEYPQSIVPFSNQREVIYINTQAYSMGTAAYLKVLAHELQHAVHWNQDPSEDTWINEGLSELAVAVAGYGANSIHRFLQSGPTSLVNWPVNPGQSLNSYGAASLFFHYLAEHYGPPEGLKLLVATPEDGVAGIDAFLQASGHSVTFRDVFRDWIVANFLDQDKGVYGYSELDVGARVRKFIDRFGDFESEIPQYSVEYVELTSLTGPLSLRFRGQSVNTLLPVDLGSQNCWWSNAGDNINSTLTRTLDLRDLDRATLNYQVWYNLEAQWDYAYLEISTNDGRTWDILETPNTSPENPVGNSYGPGYTGDSLGWITESVDLTTYAGREVRLRFQYVTDDAINGVGLCLRQIFILESGPDSLIHGWEPAGFVLTDNRVRQDFIVQVIEDAPEPRVRQMALDEANSGEMYIPAAEDRDRLVVVVAALAPKTRQPASYTLTVQPAK